MPPTTTRLPTCTSSRPRTAVRWTHPPRILSEHLAPLPEPLACLLTPGAVGPAPAVAALGARALLDLAPLALEGEAPWPAWLAPHQVPAAARLVGILARHGGALLADAVGLGKSYVALAVALALGEPFALVVPAVLVDQWRTLLEEHGAKAPIVTLESLSATPYRPIPPSTVPYRLFIVDEATRFRNPITNRYRAVAKLVIGSRGHGARRGTPAARDGSRRARGGRRGGGAVPPSPVVAARLEPSGVSREPRSVRSVPRAECSGRDARARARTPRLQAAIPCR